VAGAKLAQLVHPASKAPICKNKVST
jgi:hypothetical protein